VRPDDVDENEEFVEPLPLPAYLPPEEVGAQRYVQDLFQQPLLGESAPPAPTLRSAANDLLRSTGLFGEASAPDVTDEASRPSSWKLPARGRVPTILGDDTAAGPARGAVPNIGSLPSASDLAGATPAAPRDPTAPAVSSPLDHPDAQTGLALTAADALITRGIDFAVNLAGGNPALARTLVEAAANAIADVLPAEFRASALTSADTAATEAERRIGENDRATRTRAAIGTLANRRTEAEHDHTAAVIAGDRAKIAEARREAIEAWSAERRARGDGEAEINAGARALERRYRKTALRHRLAQLDEAGLKRALDADEDAKSDPTLAREVAEDIVLVRRDDPARVSEASIERQIEARKRDGRIDTPEEEAAARYKLRLEAQAQRGIPEQERRILTNDERTNLAAEYLRIESSQGKELADAWLRRKAQEAGTHSQQFTTELARPQLGFGAEQAPLTEPRQITELPNTAADSPKPSDADEGRVEPAQAAPNELRPPPTRKPETERRREADAEYFANEAVDAATWPAPDWIARLAELLRLAKKHEVLPTQLKAVALGLLLIGNTPNERIAAARALAEIKRLFPGSIDDLPEHHRQLAEKIDELSQDPSFQGDPDALLDEAHRQSAVPRLPPMPDLVALGIAGTSIGHRYRRGIKAQNLGAANLKDALERYGITVQEQVRYTTSAGDTVVDFRLRIGRSKRILRLIEHKTPKARWSREQKDKQTMAAQEEGVPIDLMRTAPTTGRSTVNGMPFDQYVKMLLREARRRK
jgi:hypothetical protein